MYPDTEGPVIVRPDQFGYGFSDVGFERNPPVEATPLDWTVAAQLWSLDSAGTPTEEIDQRQIDIGRLDNAYQPHLNLSIPHVVDLYRYDIQFSDHDGNRLGSYSQYLRVVPEMVKVRLGINRRRFRPGQMIATRPEVLGTNWVTYGESFEVERMSNGHWHLDPALTPREWLTWSGSAGLGGAGRCSPFKVPIDTPPGRYRVKKPVSAEVGRTHRLPLTLTARFSVTR